MTKKTKEKYAVVDLEATSASSSANIIQVGIVIVEDGEIIDSFESDVNPHQKLDTHIIQLTGITDEQLAQAPDFSQIAKPVYQLIKDCIFVAHNVKFDANLLAEALFMEGYELRTPRVDTVELTQVFYPTLEKYNLSYLAQELELELTNAHTAIADARATAQLLLRLINKMESLPKITLEMLLNFSDNLIFESEFPIRQAFSRAKTKLAQDFVQEKGIVLKRVKTYSKEYKVSQDFATNIALLNLQERQQQTEFAQTVRSQLDNSAVSFIQAQTGIGKTYGYLLSILAAQPKDKIVVAVPTKLLQDQIMDQEGRCLEETFHINCHSLKGPQNYIKLDAFYQTLLRSNDNRLVNRYKMQVLVWLTETHTGDLDEIKQKQRYQAYFDEIKHDGKLQADSLFALHDFWQMSYEKAEQAHVLITNHAYLLTRIEDDSAFIAGKVLVIDEAQKMVLALEQFSRRQLNVTKLLQDIHQLLEKEGLSLLEQRLLESLQFEWTRLLTAYQQNQIASLTREDLIKISQDVCELDASELADLADMFSPQFDTYWFEVENFQDNRIIYFKAARHQLMRLSDYLTEAKKVLAISATLAISPQVELADLLGLKNVNCFSLANTRINQQKIWIDQSMPSIGQISDKDYAESISKRVMELSTLKKPILVLFTSKHSMLAVSQFLEDNELRHLTQEKNGTAFNIKKRFDRGEANILLGMGSFWEGVDFAQQDQLIEVIARLPFDNPKDPFFQKVKTWLHNQGKQAFEDYSLPMTILRLKQAIGRTRRSQKQKSAVIILDNRLLHKSYGSSFMRSLSEEVPLSCQNFMEILTEITDFLL
ncbi:bifunctional DnaQ family exonuclease/ATP-dependent helicase [Streptococcus dentiloxodontae]